MVSSYPEQVSAGTKHYPVQGQRMNHLSGTTFFLSSVGAYLPAPFHFQRGQQASLQKQRCTFTDFHPRTRKQCLTHCGFSLRRDYRQNQVKPSEIFGERGSLKHKDDLVLPAWPRARAPCSGGSQHWEDTDTVISRHPLLGPRQLIPPE